MAIHCLVDMYVFRRKRRSNTMDRKSLLTISKEINCAALRARERTVMGWVFTCTLSGEIIQPERCSRCTRSKDGYYEPKE